MTSNTEKFDLIIIGSGPAGYLAAILAYRRGSSVALIEKSELGGTCLNRGCIPTKTLIHEGSIWHHLTESGLNRNEEEARAYFQNALKKKEGAVNQVVSGIRRLLGRDRITLIHGDASFESARTVSVKRDGEIVKTLESDRILIAAGVVPSDPPLLKRDGLHILGSDQILNIKEIPDSLAIVGAGKRGVEFASFFNTFGVEVTLIEREKQILPKMDREISVRYRGMLANRGIKTLTDSKVEAASVSDKKGSVSLVVFNKGKEEKLDFQKVLMVGDVRGNTDGLGLDKASISLKDGFIQVASGMRTSSPGIYAAGDITGNGCFAHKAFLEANIAVRNIFGEKVEVDYRLVPNCLYAYPEAASIGLTEEEAEAQYEDDLAIGNFPFAGCGRAVTSSEQFGMVKIISDATYGEILGLHILGPGATELIHLGAMAMKNEIGVAGIKEMIFAHPTLSEAFFEAVLDISDEAIHIMKG